MKNIPVRLDDVLHHRLDVKIAQDRIPSFQQLIVELLQQWLSGEKIVTPPPEPPAPSPHQQYIDALVEILESGEAGEIKAIKSNLEAFVKGIRAFKQLREFKGKLP